MIRLVLDQAIQNKTQLTMYDRMLKLVDNIPRKIGSFAINYYV